jgi:hypothetical protein
LSPSIIIPTEYAVNIGRRTIIAGNFASITVLPTGFAGARGQTEFVFIVDCSRSMSGGRIRRARECLQLFLRSLPLAQCLRLCDSGIDSSGCSIRRIAGADCTETCRRHSGESCWDCAAGTTD